MCSNRFTLSLKPLIIEIYFHLQFVVLTLMPCNCKHEPNIFLAQETYNILNHQGYLVITVRNSSNIKQNLTSIYVSTYKPSTLSPTRCHVIPTNFQSLNVSYSHHFHNFIPKSSQSPQQQAGCLLVPHIFYQIILELEILN